MKNSITLVMMAGLPGAGKTTLAYTLGRELQWQVIDKDKYKEVLLKQGLENEHAARSAYDLSFTMAYIAIVKQQTSVILDTAGLHRFVLDAVLEIVQSVAEVRLRVILCVADRDLRNHRLRNRPYQPTTIQVDPATIADYLSHFSHLPPDTLVLYTTSPPEQCLAQAKKYLTDEI